MQSTAPLAPPWAPSGWLDDVTDWIHEQAASTGHVPDGPFEQVRSEPWSIVLRVPVAGGSLYFKEPAPIIKHEVPISRMLARLQPGRVLPLLAIDSDRSWMLAPDAGPILRSTIRVDRDTGHWDRVLQEYAAIQLALVPHTDELLSLGAPNRSIEMLPQLLAAVLDDTSTLLIGQENGLSDDEYQRARDAVSFVRELTQRLASYPIPASIHHGDLHDANVFYDGSRYLIFDWSECSITHPFFSLRTAMVSVLTSFGLEDAQETEVALRLWEGYAPAWSAFGSPAQLRTAYDIARRLWTIPTLLSWYRIIASLEGEAREKHAYIIPAVIGELLEANQL